MGAVPREPQRPDAAAPSVSRAGAPSGRVLLAEDEADSREILSRMVTRLGYAVDAVADGDQVVEAYRRSTYDVILMDARMPRRDGFEAAAAIRSIEAAERRRATPIVALTARGGPRAVADSLAAGMDAHLTKPVRLEQLEEALARHVPGEAEIDREAVRELRDNLGDHFVRAVLMFVESNAARLTDVRAARGTEALADALHRLKGSSGQLGVRGLFEAAERLERAVRTGSPVGEADLDELEARARRALGQLLAEVGLPAPGRPDPDAPGRLDERGEVKGLVARPWPPNGAAGERS